MAGKRLQYILMALILLSIIFQPAPLIVRASGGFELVSTIWGSRDNPQRVYPGSRGARFVVLVENNVSNLLSVIGELSLPLGFKGLGGEAAVKSTGYVAANNTVRYRIGRGEVFELDYVVDVDYWMPPGSYYGELTLRYTSSELQSGSEKLAAPIVVSGFPTFFFQIVDLYWSTAGGQAVKAAPGARNIVLNIGIRNIGLEDASSLSAQLSLAPPFMPSRVVSSVGRVGVGATVTLAFTGISISAEAAPGSYNANLKINSTFTGYGGATSTTITILSIGLEVSDYPCSGLQVVRTQWSGGERVYAGSKGVYLDIIIQNMGDYTEGNLLVRLSLPPGFSDPYGLSTLNTTSQATLGYGSSVTLSLGPIYIESVVASGTHYANLTVISVLSQGGSSLLGKAVFQIPLFVGGSSMFVDYVASSWVGYSPSPGSVGATLMIVLRNTGVPVMRGIVAGVALPLGFNSTITGTRFVNVSPYVAVSVAQLQNLIRSPSAFFSTPLTQPQQPQAGLGEFLIVPVSLSISDKLSPGYYPVTVSINFLDQLGALREASVNGSLWLPGSTYAIHVVEGKSRLLVGNRTAEISIYLRNNGTAPVYNVYVAIATPQAPVSVLSAVKYLPLIKPNEEINISWVASVNPIAGYLGSTPAILNIVFTDPVGTLRNFTQTAFLFVEGAAELKLIDVKAESVAERGAYVSISMTILNLGTYKAKSLEASIEGSGLEPTSSSYSFIGDVDVGSQVPLTLSALLVDKEAERVTVSLTLRYRNIFNELVTERHPMTVPVARQPAQVVQPSQPIIDSFKILVVASIGGFLSISGYVIYLLYRKTRRSGGVP